MVSSLCPGGRGWSSNKKSGDDQMMVPIDFPNSPIWHPQYLPRCDTPPIREQAQEAHCTKAPKRWYWGLANKRNIKCNRNHSKQLSKGRKKWATIVIKTPMHELVQCVGLGMTRACFLYWSHYVTIISRLWWRSAFNTRNSAIPVRWSWNESCTPSTCLLQNAIPRMNQSINQSNHGSYNYYRINRKLLRKNILNWYVQQRSRNWSWT